MPTQDYGSDTTGNSLYYSITITGNSIDSTAYYDDGGVTWTFRIPPPRTRYVRIPKHWKKSKIAGFAGLVNEETHTGYRVTALVKVVQIYEKRADVITMDQFKVLLLERANAADQQTILSWFKNQ